MLINSLSFRLLISAAIVLATLFAFVSLMLEQGFRESAEQALSEKLQVHVNSLLSAAELTDTGELKMPANLPEPRFATPGSGLYAFIQQKNSTKKLIWHSPSAIGLTPPVASELLPGNSIFWLNEKDRYAFQYDVVWQNKPKVEREYIITVTEDARFVNNQVRGLDTTLRAWLTGFTIVLIYVQFAVMRWSLKPLRTIGKDLEAIEKGTKSHLDGKYPTELQSLAGNMNALITSERALLERYRNTLADLAHSLKTPLAILRGCVDTCGDNASTVHEQITRMNEIVDYQLQRAAAKGETSSARTVDVPVMLNKIVSSLSKVYHDKGVKFTLQMPERVLLYCDEGDLYEIAGNLMDNACKWCKEEVKITVSSNAKKGRKNFSFVLTIEDDGPGIPAGKLAEILKRGVRADQNIHGHGIGMAVVNELIGLLGGRLEGTKSADLGGMKWRVLLP